jgi:plasmid maintenance system antidote protein VapI
MSAMAESRGSQEFTAAIQDIGTNAAAKQLGVVPSMVSHLKSGLKRPSLALAVRIWAILGVSPDAWEEKARKGRAS